MARARKPINTPNSGMSPELKTMAAIAAVILIGVGYFLSADKSDPEENEKKTAEVATSGVLQPYSTGSAAHGDLAAKAVLVKYTDFQ